MPGDLASQDINVAGPLARSARDLEFVLRAIVAPPADAAVAPHLNLPRCDATGLSDIRFGILPHHPVAEVDNEVEQCLIVLGRTLEKARASVVWSARPTLDTAQLLRTYTLLLRASTSYRPDDEAFAAALSLGDAADPEDASYASLQHLGTSLRHWDWLKLQSLRDARADESRRLFDQVDVLLCPVAATAAFPVDEVGAPWQRTLTVNGRAQPLTTQLFWAGHSGLCGLPLTAAPAGTTLDGRPVGVQIVAPLFQDLQSLRGASLLEAAGYVFKPPV